MNCFDETTQNNSDSLSAKTREKPLNFLTMNERKEE